MYKKISIFVIMLIILMTPTVSVYGNENRINVIVNNNRLEFDVQPIIVEGRTLVPLRKIFESLGAIVLWDGENRIVTASNDNNFIILPIDSRYATVSNRKIELDVAARIMEGRAMVPLRFIAESLGADVKWNHNTKTVSINLDNQYLSEKDSSTYSAINATVKSLTFFESDYNQEERNYNNYFSKHKSRYINFELELDYPTQTQKRDFTIKAVYYGPSNTVISTEYIDFYVDKGWTESLHVYGYGNNQPGYWEIGTYSVELFDGNNIITRGNFTIIEENANANYKNPDDIKKDISNQTSNNLWFDNGEYKGEVKNNKANGWGVWLTTDGVKYEGEFRDNKWHGNGILSYEGNKYVGVFRNGEMYGEGTYLYSNGDSITGEWINGIFVEYSTKTTIEETKIKGPLSLIADDNDYTFLGKLTTNIYDSDSIYNEYGTYGSKYSTKSIWNDYSNYGGEYSSYSPFNSYSLNPPYIVDEDFNVLGRLTVNKYIEGAIHPNELYFILEELGF